jgi:hypothetical protein
MPPLPLRAATIDQERLLFKLFRQDYTFANLPREENLDRWENQGNRVKEERDNGLKC